MMNYFPRLFQLIPCAKNFIYPRYYAKHIRKNRLPNDQKSPNAFNLYVKEHTQHSTGVPMPEMIRSLAKKWKEEESEEVKNRLKKESERMHKEALENFRSSPSLEQMRMKEEYHENLLKRKKKQKAAILKKYRTDTYYPKRPPNIWSMYVMDCAEREKKSTVEVAKNVGADFKNLSDEEKQRYKEKYADLREKHKMEVKKWKNEYGVEYEKIMKSLATKINVSVPDEVPEAIEGKPTGLFRRLKKDKKNAKMDPPSQNL